MRYIAYYSGSISRSGCSGWKICKNKERAADFIEEIARTELIDNLSPEEFISNVHVSPMYSEDCELRINKAIVQLKIEVIE